jgi:hypothetical protein
MIMDSSIRRLSALIAKTSDAAIQSASGTLSDEATREAQRAAAASTAAAAAGLSAHVAAASAHTAGQISDLPEAVQDIVGAALKAGGTNVAITYNDATGETTISVSIPSASDITSGTLADARLSSNVPLLNAANTFTAAQGIGAAPALVYALTAYQLTSSVATLDAAILAELDATNTADTAYQSAAIFATNRYRGTTNATSGSASKGQVGVVSSVFNYNTGTTLLVGGSRLDVRNLGTGTVTRMAGHLINAMLNSGGGAVTSAYGMYLETQAAGATNWQLYSDGGNSRWGAGYHEMSEMTAPAAGAANSARLYVEDNGAGKTRLMVKFATGSAVQIAIQP